MNEPTVVNEISLEEGQYTPLPHSPDYVLVGPGKIRITRYKQGQLQGQILEGTSRPVEFALVKHMKRVSWGT